MSFQARRELLAQVAPRYREASRNKRSLILDEFVASTGYARKYAIRLLSRPIVPSGWRIRRTRERRYGEALQEALQTAWAAANYIGSKRLAPFLPELIGALERHGHLSLPGELREQLLRVSPATIDRMLRTYRTGRMTQGIGTTKPCRLLKHQVPVRTFADWNETEPGFLEADLVAHCGWSTEGAYLNTLVLTDLATGWIECLALLTKGRDGVLHALECTRQLIPFPIQGLQTMGASFSMLNCWAIVSESGSHLPGAAHTKRTINATWSRKTGRGV